MLAELTLNYEIVNGQLKAVGEPFSAQGDMDGDGISNLQEAQNILAHGGTLDDFVVSASNPLLDGAGTMNPVWLNFSYPGTENGSQAQPFNTLREGLIAVLPGGTVNVTGGVTLETPRLTKPAVLAAPSGLVRIGGN